MSSLLEQQLALAGATIRCYHDKEQAWDIPGVDERCSDCNGTNEVYLFPDEVRVPCHITALVAKDAMYGFGKRVHPEGCGRCKGRGWTLATDGWVWWQAVKQAGIWMTLTNDDKIFEATGEGVFSEVDNDNPEQVFFHALVSVVKDKDIMNWIKGKHNQVYDLGNYTESKNDK